jgi:hypothetical protein
MKAFRNSISSAFSSSPSSRESSRPTSPLPSEISPPLSPSFPPSRPPSRGGAPRPPSQPSQSSQPSTPNSNQLFIPNLETISQNTSSSNESDVSSTRLSRVFRISTVRRRKKAAIAEVVSTNSSIYSANNDFDSPNSNRSVDVTSTSTTSSVSESESRYYQSFEQGFVSTIESTVNLATNAVRNVYSSHTQRQSTRGNSNVVLTDADRKLAALINTNDNNDTISNNDIYNIPSPSNTDLDLGDIDLEDDVELEFRSSWNLFVNLSVVSALKERGIAPEFTLLGCGVLFCIFLRYWCTWTTIIRTSLYLFSFFRSFRALEKLSAYSGESLQQIQCHHNLIDYYPHLHRHMNMPYVASMHMHQSTQLEAGLYIGHLLYC